MEEAQKQEEAKEKVSKPRLTEAERAEIRAKKKAKLKIALTKLEKTEASQQRKKRVRELIKIGLAVSSGKDRKKILEYLENPKYLYVKTDGSGLGISTTKPTDDVKYMLMFDPSIIC